MSKAVGLALAYVVGVVTGNWWVFTVSLYTTADARENERRSRNQARDAYNASLRDRNIMVRGTTEPRELVLGRVRKSGQFYPIGSIGANNEKFVFCVLLAGHEIDAIEEVWFNDQPLTLDANGMVLTQPFARPQTVSAGQSVTVAGGSATLTLPTNYVAGSLTVTWGDYERTPVPEASISVAGTVATITGADGAWAANYQVVNLTPKARVTWHLGTDTQAASPRLLTLFPTKWTSAHRLRGIPYIVVELDFDQDAFPTGLPTVSAVTRGAKVFDPRTGITAWSENPALLIRAAATHPLCGRLSTVYMDDAAIGTAADICDASVTYTVTDASGASSTVTRARYTAGTVCRSDQVPQQCLNELLAAMSGRQTFAGGKYRIKSGYTAPVADITADWFAPGSVQYTPSVPRQDLKNVVQGSFVDPAAGWQVVPFPRVVDSAAVTADGAELVSDVTMGAVTYGPQAQQVATNQLREARNAATFAATFNLRALPLQVLDTVTITLDRYGLAAKVFEVVQRSYTPDGGIGHAFRELDPSFYATGSSFTLPASTANTTLPAPGSVAAPGALTVQSGTDQLLMQSDGTVLSRAYVTWPALTDRAVLQGGTVEVAYTRADHALPAAWPSVSVDGAATGAYVAGLQDGAPYLFKARAVTATPVRSDWGVQVQHTVIGKTEPPPDVVNFTVVEGPNLARAYFWDYPNPPADLGGFRVRYIDATLPVGWASMVPLFEAGRLERSASVQSPADGFWTIAIKAVDQSGNESVNAKTITGLFDQSGFSTVIATIDAGALGWPGTKTGASVVSFYLADTGTATWDTIPTTWDAWLTWDGPSASPIVYQHTTVDVGASTVLRIREGHVATGTVTVEYQSSTDGTTYTGWAALPAGTFTARYVRVRWTVADALPVLYRAYFRLYA